MRYASIPPYMSPWRPLKHQIVSNIMFFSPWLVVQFSENQHFSKKSIPYWASAQSTKTKMTANGFSSYELFVKKCDFCCILQYFLPLFTKTHFFILPHINIVYRGLCAPTSETSCSSYFMKTDRQKPNFKLALSPQIQDQKNPGPLQTEAQRLTM